MLGSVGASDASLMHATGLPRHDVKKSIAQVTVDISITCIVYIRCLRRIPVSTSRVPLHCGRRHGTLSHAADAHSYTTYDKGQFVDYLCAVKRTRFSHQTPEKDMFEKTGLERLDVFTFGLAGMRKANGCVYGHPRVYGDSVINLKKRESESVRAAEIVLQELPSRYL